MGGLDCFKPERTAALTLRNSNALVNSPKLALIPDTNDCCAAYAGWQPARIKKADRKTRQSILFKWDSKTAVAISNNMHKH